MFFFLFILSFFKLKATISSTKHIDFLGSAKMMTLLAIVHFLAQEERDSRMHSISPYAETLNIFKCQIPPVQQQEIPAVF